MKSLQQMKRKEMSLNEEIEIARANLTAAGEAFGMLSHEEATKKYKEAHDTYKNLTT